MRARSASYELVFGGKALVRGLLQQQARSPAQGLRMPFEERDQGESRSYRALSGVWNERDQVAGGL